MNRGYCEVANPTLLLQTKQYIQDYTTLKEMSARQLFNEARTLRRVGHVATMRIAMILVELRNRAIGEGRDLKRVWPEIAKECEYSVSYVQSLVRVAENTAVSYMPEELLSKFSTEALIFISQRKTMGLPNYREALKRVKAKAAKGEKALTLFEVRVEFYPMASRKDQANTLERLKSYWGKSNTKTRLTFINWIADLKTGDSK